MAFSFDSGGGFGRRRRTTPTLSEINIVPLVDVVLVLLIIFMLTAQAIQFGLEIEVPKVQQQTQSGRELPILSLSRDGNLRLNDQPVNINQLGEAIRARFGQKVDAVYVRADKQTTWDLLAQVVAALGKAKINPRMVTELDEGGK